MTRPEGISRDTPQEVGDWLNKIYILTELVKKLFVF